MAVGLQRSSTHQTRCIVCGGWFYLGRAPEVRWERYCFRQHCQRIKSEHIRLLRGERPSLFVHREGVPYWKQW